jgi:hypothetical protein
MTRYLLLRLDARRERALSRRRVRQIAGGQGSEAPLI